MWWSLTPATRVLGRRKGEDTERRPSEDRGREWGDAAQVEEHPEPQELEETEKGLPECLQREDGPTDTSISDCWLPKL